MSKRTDVATAQVARTVNPFQREADKRLSAGAVAIESERAIAEAQGRLVIAKRYPRDRVQAMEAILDECSRPGLADAAEYNFPRGGSRVVGPTIRLAEMLARCWGNIDFGIRELSRNNGESEMEAYAWDLETNTRSVQAFTVRHRRDTRGGGKALTDERDIYEIGANMGARRLRARILSVIPGDVIDAALDQCKKTRQGQARKPMADRIAEAQAAFREMGVSTKQLEAYLGHPLADLTPDSEDALRGLYRGIRDGMVNPSEVFKAAHTITVAANPNGDPNKSQQDALASELEGGTLSMILDRLDVAESTAQVDALVKQGAGLPAMAQQQIEKAAQAALARLGS